MVTKKEVIHIIIAIVIFTLILSFNNNFFSYAKIPAYLLMSLTIILVSVFAKKITASKLDIKIEHEVWKWSRYWITKKSYLPFSVPIGFFLPALIGFLTAGSVKFLTFLQFESEALPSKASKAYGRRRFSTVMEWDDAMIGFYGLISVLLLAVIAKLFVSPNPSILYEFSKYALYFGAYNLIPFSKLDGMRIFMGSRPLYVFSLVLAALTALVIFF